MRLILFLSLCITLSACSSYEPRPKQAVYDPNSKELVMPYPCPDWSHSSANYDNAPDSNYGCAVENNLAVQLDDPSDLLHGHGTPGPDREIDNHVIELYRAGTIPTPLKPMQDTSGGQ